MPGVGDDQPSVVYQHPGRQIHPALGSTAVGRPALGGAVGLAKDDVGGLLVGSGQTMPHQYSVVAGIGDDEVVLAKEDPSREYIQAIVGRAGGNAKPPGDGAPNHSSGAQPPLRSTVGAASTRAGRPLTFIRTVYRLTT